MRDGSPDAWLGHILLVEDDDGFAQNVLSPSLPPTWAVHFAYNFPQAVRLIDELGRIDAALVDYALPGGNGIEVLGRLREKYAAIPAALFTAYLQADLAQLCYELRCGYLVKENAAEVVRLFAARLPDGLPAHRQPGTLDRFAREHNISPRQLQIVSLAMQGYDRARIAMHLGLSENTVKTHATAILKKAKVESLRELTLALRDDRPREC